jgi:hypothetical protein
MKDPTRQLMNELCKKEDLRSEVRKLSNTQRKNLVEFLMKLRHHENEMSRKCGNKRYALKKQSKSNGLDENASETSTPGADGSTTRRPVDVSADVAVEEVYTEASDRIEKLLLS